MKGTCGDTMRLLLRSPDLMKVVAAAGLLAAATIMSPITPMILIELRSEIWGERMSSYTALFNSANGVVAMLFSSSFGRFGDKVGRRIAMNAVGVLGFLPTWSLLVFGCNATGLTAFSVTSVFGGVACITVTGCPTAYALVCDVMAPEDREVAFGICFAGVVLVAIFANFAGLMLNAVFHGRDLPILLYLLLLDILYFITVALVHIPKRPDVAWSEDVEYAGGGEFERHGVDSADEATGDFTEVGGTSSDSSDSSAGSGAESAPPAVRMPSVLAPLELLRRQRSLATLCAVAALVSLPEIMLTDVSAQYSLNQFGLVHTVDNAKQEEVTLLFQWPGYALLLPAFFVTGLLAKRFSALSLLRMLIPLTGVLLSLPVLLRFAPRMWLVPIVGISVPLAMVVFAPLQTLITQLAPEGRVGEAMGAIGASKQVAGLLSNLLVSGLVPVLLSTGMSRPLWIFYPLATACSLTAFALTLSIKAPASSGSEPAAIEKEVASPRRPMRPCPRKQASADAAATDLGVDDDFDGVAMAARVKARAVTR